MQFKRVGATQLWLPKQFHSEQIADQMCWVRPKDKTG